MRPLLAKLFGTEIEFSDQRPLSVNEQAQLLDCIGITARRFGVERALQIFRSGRDPDELRDLISLALGQEEEPLLPPNIEFKRTK